MSDKPYQFGGALAPFPKSHRFCSQSASGVIKIPLLVTEFLTYVSPFSPGGTKNDVVDGPCVQIHQLWPSVPHPWGLLHQTGKELARDSLNKLCDVVFYCKSAAKPSV